MNTSRLIIDWPIPEGAGARSRSRPDLMATTMCFGIHEAVTANARSNG